MMLGFLGDLLNWHNPLFLVFGAFSIWMLVDALRRQEYLWAVFIFVFPVLNAPLYFFLVYRQAASGVRGFELPGAHHRRRIRELQTQIHHLDKAHHHSQLGDVYFQQGKLAQAETCYRAALDRDPDDLDTLAHFGQCLLRLGRPHDGLPYLEKVCAREPGHDYGHSLMALAETYTALGRTSDSIDAWRRVLESHTYPRARVQLATLYLAAGRPELARSELEEVVADDPHAPAFQRRREKVWVARARALLRRLR